MTKDDKNEVEEVEGVVVEALPNLLFKVKVEELDNPLLAYLSGKMRINRIRTLVGDRVFLVLSKYEGKARITKRL